VQHFDQLARELFTFGEVLGMSGFEQVESLSCDEVPEADKDGLARLSVDLNVS